MASSSGSAYKSDDRAKDGNGGGMVDPPSRRSRSPQQGYSKNFAGSQDNNRDRRNDSGRWSSREAGPSRPRDRNGKGGKDRDFDWKSRKNRDRGWGRSDDLSKKRDREPEGRYARGGSGKSSLESRLEPRHESSRKIADDDEEEDEETRQRRIERLKRRRRSAGFDSDDETVTLEDLIAARQKARDDDREMQRKNDRSKDDDRNDAKGGTRPDRRDRDEHRSNKNKDRDRDRHSRDDGYNHRDRERYHGDSSPAGKKVENGKKSSPHTDNDHYNGEKSRGWDRNDDRQTSPVARILRRRIPSSSPPGREREKYPKGNEVFEDTITHNEKMEADHASLTEHITPSVPLRAGPGEVYDRVAQVGEGTYGQVFKAKSDKTGITVALKKIRMESERDGFPITALREVKLLQGLKHENVVRLHEMMLSKHSIYMVFEYLQHDLNGILAQPSITFSPAHIKSLAAQLLSGLAYLHKHRILHRDLKCSNLLLNNEGTLKLADFGLARTYVKQTRPSARNKTLDYTNRVVTLWYRAPELLFGETSYDDAIDVWGAGCIFLELFLRRPIFQGMDEIHQVQLLFEILGPVSKDEWPEAERLPWFDLIRPASNDENGTSIKSHKDHLRTLLGSEEQVPDDALEVALSLLTYNPRKRVSAVEGLALPYFTTSSPPAEKPAALLQAVQGEWHEFESRKARREAAAQALQDHVHREKEQQRVRNEVGQPQMSDKVTITPSTQEPVQDTTMSSIATPTMVIDEALQRKEEREASA